MSRPIVVESWRPAEAILPAATVESVMTLEGAGDRPISTEHDRCLTPSDTLARIRPHFAKLGITRIGDVTGLDSLEIPVAFAARPNSFSLSVNLGKGTDIASARASAAMEATELAVAERLPDGGVLASVSELSASGSALVDLSQVARCQPHRLDPDEPLLWVEGRELFSGKTLMVPWALVGLDHRVAPKGYHDAFEVATDGLASGNTPAEAVLHGICELIERDAFAQLELMQPRKLQHLRRSVVTPGPQLQGLLDRIARRGLELRLFEMTSDIAVPAYFAVLSQPERDETAFHSWSSLCGGCGCHPSPVRAMTRAISEAAQARLAMAAAARDDLPRSHYRPTEKFTKASVPEELGMPMEMGKALSRAPARAAPASSMGERILMLLASLASAGINQVISVELNAKDLGIGVTRVIIPELQIPLHGLRTQVLRRGLRQLVEASR
jgi:YcaO-like protein with predicted kinase domain